MRVCVCVCIDESSSAIYTFWLLTFIIRPNWQKPHTIQTRTPKKHSHITINSISAKVIVKIW